MQFNLAGSAPRAKARVYFEKLMSREKGVIEVKQVRDKRSNQQNKYLHLVLTDMGNSLGYSLDEIKTLVKRHCGLAYKKGEYMFLRSTADLDKKEFGEFVANMQRWAAESFDYYCPDPNEIIDNTGEQG